jgi:hypothetical protein
MNLWNNPNVPHKGWKCVGLVDLGRGVYQTCEMCGNERIRFVHKMQHSAEYRPLAVGCICAERMSEDYVGPKQREKSLKSRVSRRERWLSRRWKISTKGNPWIKTGIYHIVAYPFGNVFRLCIDGKMGTRNYHALDAARLAAFDAVEAMKARELRNNQVLNTKPQAAMAAGWFPHLSRSEPQLSPGPCPAGAAKQ